MSTESPPQTTVQLIYLGQRRSSTKSDLHATYQRIDPEANDGSRLKPDPERVAMFKKKSVPRGLMVGQIIECKANADHTKFSIGSAKTVGRWQNTGDVAEWNALHRAAVSEDEENRADIKKIKEALPAESLAPFRRAYQSARNSRQQAHILAWVIQEITRYR